MQSTYAHCVTSHTEMGWYYLVDWPVGRERPHEALARSICWRVSAERLFASALRAFLLACNAILNSVASSQQCRNSVALASRAALSCTYFISTAAALFATAAASSAALFATAAASSAFFLSFILPCSFIVGSRGVVLIRPMMRDVPKNLPLDPSILLSCTSPFSNGHSVAARLTKGKIQTERTDVSDCIVETHVRRCMTWTRVLRICPKLITPRKFYAPTISGMPLLASLRTRASIKATVTRILPRISIDATAALLAA